jgi:hypothetical protein
MISVMHLSCVLTAVFLIEFDHDKLAEVEICASCIVPNIKHVTEIFRKNNCGSYFFQMIKAHKPS